MWACEEMKSVLTVIVVLVDAGLAFSVASSVASSGSLGAAPSVARVFSQLKVLS